MYPIFLEVKGLFARARDHARQVSRRLAVFELNHKDWRSAHAVGIEIKRLNETGSNQRDVVRLAIKHRDEVSLDGSEVVILTEIVDLIG